ncbi:MAG: hypothetical protein JWM52_315 [Candidatus Saccharibacteria bacterium]|nr:hypothetical protein [Candidatus Saccharibacteria bacterium]
MNDETNTPQEKSSHIIGPSSTLLGFSFLVLTSINSLNLSTKGITDEISGLCVVLYSFSTIFSFASIRSFHINKRRINYEKIADYTFLTALVLTALASVLLVFGIVKIGG